MTAVQTEALALEHVFDYEVDLNPPVPFGRRLFYEAVGGEVSGPRLRGEVLRGGGDWVVVDADGTLRLDVRGHCRTDDGALLYFSYDGVLVPSDVFSDAVASGGETAFDDQYWRVAIRVETGDSRYRWLTQCALVARGRLRAGGVGYQVFRVG